MRGWPALMLVAAAAFASAIVTLLVGRLLPATWGDPVVSTARSFVVGSGAILAATTVLALYDALLRQVHPQDDRPLVSVHPRRRG